MAEMKLAGVEAVGLDGAVAVGGEVAVFQVADNHVSEPGMWQNGHDPGAVRHRRRRQANALGCPVSEPQVGWPGLVDRRGRGRRRLPGVDRRRHLRRCRLPVPGQARRGLQTGGSRRRAGCRESARA